MTVETHRHPTVVAGVRRRSPRAGRRRARVAPAAAGDRFTLHIDGFEGDVFTLSDMVVEAQEHETGIVLGFNGTTEWALDSAQLTDALWLPREDQVRELLGVCFRRLERAAAGFRVAVLLPGARREREFDGRARPPRPTAARCSS